MNALQQTVYYDKLLSEAVRMIISFCGHAAGTISDGQKDRIEAVLRRELAKAPDCKFYLGGYGTFDETCRVICKKLKEEFVKTELVFVTPYIDPDYYKLRNAREYYDSVVYPPIERVPRRLAIIKRNEWMANNSDLIMACVRCKFGGAAQTLAYATRKNIPVVNVDDKYDKKGSP